MSRLGRVAAFKVWFMNALENYPGVVTSTFLPIIATPLALYHYFESEKQGGFSNKYLLHPLVVRPGDRRIQKIHTTHPLDEYYK